MIPPVREMPEEERRRHQRSLGLVVVNRRQESQTEKRTRRMDDNLKPQTGHGNVSRAQQTIDRLLESPSYKEVALHELKRATVYVPLLLSAGIGLIWMNKRLFVPVG